MFGQKDDNQNQSTNGQPDPMQAVNDGAAQLLATDPSESTDVINPGTSPVASATTAASAGPDWPHPGTPVDNATTAEASKDVISPAGGYPSSPNDRIATETTAPFPPDAETTEEAQPAPSLVSSDDVTDAELVEIKQKALSELIPLIDKLDQPPHEKFRTIMMMIQASDDQQLVEKAYESAHSIEDEEDRAQALLDIVNEINYFTQQPKS